MNRWIAVGAACLAALALGACSSGRSPEASAPDSQPSSSQEASAGALEEFGAAERYYDYFYESNVNLLLCEEGEAFTDTQVAAYVLTVLVEESGDFGRYETGFTPQEMNEAAEKYCGCTIADFNTPMTRLDEETGMVCATGWGGTATWWVLHDLREGEDGLRTGEFYYFTFSPDSDLPDPQRMKKQLLAGEFTSYGVPYLARMTFREKTDPQTGETYLQILSLERLGDGQPPYTVYGME